MIVQDHVRQPVAAGPVQRLVQVRSLSGQDETSSTGAPRLFPGSPARPRVYPEIRGSARWHGRADPGRPQLGLVP